MEGVPWNCHRDAGSPENLERLVKALEKINKAPTVLNVRMVMQAWSEQEERERKREFDKAEDARIAAEEEEKAAKREAAKAKDDAERDRAEKRVAKAQAKKQEAKEQKKEATKAPKTRTFKSEPPPKGELEIAALCIKIQADAKSIVKMLSKNLTVLDKIIDDVDPEFVDGIIESHAGIISIAMDIKDRFDKKRRFSVVKGGVA